MRKKQEVTHKLSKTKAKQKKQTHNLKKNEFAYIINYNSNKKSNYH